MNDGQGKLRDRLARSIEANGRPSPEERWAEVVSEGSRAIEAIEEMRAAATTAPGVYREYLDGIDALLGGGVYSPGLRDLVSEATSRAADVHSGAA